MLCSIQCSFVVHAGQYRNACVWLLSLRACAEKMEIGVNFVAETPNLDRVVEMSALTQALNKAFPDMTPDQYPWPTSHQGDTGRVTGSWPAPPKTRTSASGAQQALDRIRQAALPAARPHSASRASANLSKQQQVVTPRFCHCVEATLMLCQLAVIFHEGPGEYLQVLQHCKCLWRVCMTQCLHLVTRLLGTYVQVERVHSALHSLQRYIHSPVF